MTVGGGMAMDIALPLVDGADKSTTLELEPTSPAAALVDAC